MATRIDNAFNRAGEEIDRYFRAVGAAMENRPASSLVMFATVYLTGITCFFTTNTVFQWSVVVGRNLAIAIVTTSVAESIFKGVDLSEMCDS